MENEGGVLHVVVFPWLAMGHLIPFLHLSKCLASRGHRVSFVSTPRNLSTRLPKIPPDLSPSINLIGLPLPRVDNLSEEAESSMDIPYQKAQLLKRAFDLLKPQLAAFLENATPRPDWIVYDYASHWLPSLAAELGISRAYFSLFTAATIAFCVPPSPPLTAEDVKMTAEDFTVVPKWIPFESNVVYRPHEIKKFIESSNESKSDATDIERFAVSIGESDVVLFRTCVEFERDWFDLVCDLHRKPLVSVGFLPPAVVNTDTESEDDEKWVEIKCWLDKQRVNSVVYVALGTEATLSQDELTELSLGLEKSRLPFFWLLRKPPGSTRKELEILPDGFVDRVKDRAMVYVAWAPQVKILGHPAVGGFLTHGGWNSVIEGLSYGRVPILFPVMNDQGLNARLLCGKKLGLEIERNEEDGSFTSDSVAGSVRLAMVSGEGETLRSNARGAKGLFGDKDINERYVDSFVRYFLEKRASQ